MTMTPETNLSATRAQDGHPACLIVDDLDENLLALEALLLDLDVRVLKARSADEALELLLAHEFALALVDVHMPGVSGLELAGMMHGLARTRKVPVILVTAARYDEARMFSGYDAGSVVDFLYKPLTPHVVRSKVQVLLELDRRRRELAAQLWETEQALAQVEAARHALADATLLRERLVAIVSHDLRTPLNAVMLSAQILARRSLPEYEHGIVGRMLRSTERMAAMIAELLDFSRAHQGEGFPVARQECDLARLCEGIVDELRAAHPGRAIALSICASPLVGHWDQRALGQALTNVISNAVHHGDASEVSVTVDRADDARVAVHNRGEPIPTEFLPLLFDPYRRARPESDGQGLGLGLYITREIVHAHGGTISVTSSVPEGTRFTLRLPLAP